MVSEIVFVQDSSVLDEEEDVKLMDHGVRRKHQDEEDNKKV